MNEPSHNFPEPDPAYIQDLMLRLLSLHSPTGYTDGIVHLVCEELDSLNIEFELTRRGAIRATLPGKKQSPDRAVVAHLDTLGAMVRELKPNGRLALVPVGTWSARFAEGGRVSVYTDTTMYRGTVLPLRASGHIFNEGIDNQPIAWEQIEVRIDQNVDTQADLELLGFRVGDFVGFDSCPEITPNGYINSRHLDDKAGAAALLAAARAVSESSLKLPIDCHVLFTISEETGSGASAVLHGDVAEMVTIDNGTAGPGQNSREHGVTIAMGDSSGPFDYHLTHHLLHLCRESDIPHVRDIFRHYRCDSASAVEAGNDIRTALLTFGVDSSHGYERTHMDALVQVTRLMIRYLASEPMFRREAAALSPIEGFPDTKTVSIDSIGLSSTDGEMQSGD